MKRWTEKHRPTELDDFICSYKILKQAKNLIKTDIASNVIISGNFGCGKTSLAKLIMNQCGFNVRSPKDRKINDVREVYSVTTAQTIYGEPYCAFIDEADELEQITQKRMLKYLEGRNTTVKSTILVVNDINKIHPGIMSRCNHIDMDWNDISSKDLKRKIRDRCKAILDSENVKYSTQKINRLINDSINEPIDIRRIINDLQFNTIDGVLEH